MKKTKVPRRIIHFASGETMEEYSTDEEEQEEEKRDLLPTIDVVRFVYYEVIFVNHRQNDNLGVKYYFFFRANFLGPHSCGSTC